MATLRRLPITKTNSLPPTQMPCSKPLSLVFRRLFRMAIQSRVSHKASKPRVSHKVSPHPVSRRIHPRQASRKTPQPQVLRNGFPLRVFLKSPRSQISCNALPRRMAHKASPSQTKNQSPQPGEKGLPSHRQHRRRLWLRPWPTLCLQYESCLAAKKRY